MIWIKIFAVVGILACAVILVAVGGVVVTAIQDRRQRRFARLDDRIDDTKSEINMWLTDNQKRLDDLEERISLCKASVEKIDAMTDGRLTKLEVDINKHIGYLDTVYDVLKWNVKDLDFDRIRYDVEMLKTVDACNTNLHNRITALELMANTTEVHVRVPE